MTTQRRRSARGQSLVEYALLLALVAVVVIVIAFGVGLAAQRIFAVVGGALSAKYDTSTGTHIVEITTAQCISLKSVGQTGLWVIGNTNDPVADLTGSTELGMGPVSGNGVGSFRYNPIIAYVADPSKCPKSITIQSKSGAIAVAPLAVSEP